MSLEILSPSAGEVWLMSVLLLIGCGFILFGKGVEFIFVGMIVLGGIVSIAYTNHSAYQQERFALQRFHEGRALICGMWRGENVRVDPKTGWNLEEGVGFVKGDMIVNDVGVCRVIGEHTPEPSSVPYAFTYAAMVGVMLGLRALYRVNRKGDHESDSQ